MRPLLLASILAWPWAALAAEPKPRADEIPLALPTDAPRLDLSQLKDTSLCVFPFVKESATGSGDKKYLDSIQKTFFDVAKDSPLLKDAVLLGDTTSRCEPHDAACFAGVGRLARCQNVLVGSSAAKGNGFVLSVRIFDVARQRVIPGSEVEQVLETDRLGDVQAWAEGQACRALQVKCAGRISVDADRKDMTIYVDNRLAPRSFKTPEVIPVEPGVHAVRVAVGQRTSLEKKVAVRRGGFSETVYARQTEKGGIPLWLASDLHGARPEPSVDVSEGGWKRPAGYTAAALGAVLVAVGVYEGLHSKSLVDQAEKNYAANGNTYLASDVANLNSAHSAATLGTALTWSGVALIAAGGVLVFAF
ncbi:MAG TPA: hypothetical protein VMK66_20210 [Myxococcales bacterium]|nr:hypothetical protein [Myxococcales bacterium]